MIELRAIANAELIDIANAKLTVIAKAVVVDVVSQRSRASRS